MGPLSGEFTVADRDNYGVGIDYEYNPVIGWVRPKAVASFNETRSNSS